MPLAPEAPGMPMPGAPASPGGPGMGPVWHASKKILLSNGSWQVSLHEPESDSVCIV